MKHISIRQLFFFLFFSFLFFFSAVLVNAQPTNEDAAKKYGITFPIASLGNCTDYTSCRNYCEDETHRDACIQYAKQKGFYEERKTDEILTRAKTELGCTSETECKNTCEKEENFEKCANFAQKTGLSKGQVMNPKSKEILTKAKEILGCDSPQSCKSVCEQEGNRQKCSEFAKQTGLKGGEERRGPGGCNSEESCKSFCSSPDNFKECSKFKPPEGEDRRGGPSQEGFRGPGGCNSESSCREYCEKNPSECQKFGPGPEGKEGKQGEPLKGMKREEMEKLCKENPEKCKEQFGGGGPPQNMKQENIQSQDMEKFCKENPEKCKEGQGSPDTFCRDNPDKCRGQGPQSGTSGFKPPEFREGQRPDSQERRNEEFRPPENFQRPPENQDRQPEQRQESSQNQGPPPEVKGAAAVRSIIETIFHLLFEK